jgi:hypothetical protein
MAHADDATKAWVSATPTVNADDNVSRWNLKYKYTLAVSGSGNGNVRDADGNLGDDYVYVSDSTIRIATPSKAKTAYTQAELLTLDDGGKQIKTHWDNMFNKKYAYHISDKTADATTVDASFDVTGLSAS